MKESKTKVKKEFSSPVKILPLLGHMKPGEVAYATRESIVVHNNQYYIKKSDYRHSHMVEPYVVELNYESKDYIKIAEDAELKDQPVYAHSFLQPKANLYFGPYKFSENPINFLEFKKNIIVYADLLTKHVKSVEKGDAVKQRHYEDDILEMFNNELLVNDVHWFYGQYLSFSDDVVFHETLLAILTKKVKEYFATNSLSMTLSLLSSFDDNGFFSLATTALDSISKDALNSYVNSFRSITSIQDLMDEWENKSSSFELDDDDEDYNEYIQTNEVFMNTRMIPEYERRIRELNLELSDTDVDGKTLEELQNSLDIALQNEDFDAAAKFRDKINEIKNR